MLGGEVTAGERADVLARMASHALRLVYVSPERLTGLADDLAARGVRVARLAVDEAHCVVEWGHDFRPAYRRIGAARVRLGNPPCTALTGTATPAVRVDIMTNLGLGPEPTVIIGSFDRPNLRFRVRHVYGTDERLARLVRAVRAEPRAAIVYGPTRNLVEGIARAMRAASIEAAPYHAGMQPDERRRTLNAFVSDGLRVVAATSAFGMGIDKPDVGLVAHWAQPASPEAYYQEAGRAGRDGQQAECLLFAHPHDAAVPRRQLDVTFPEERLVESLWANPAARPRYPANLLASVDRLAEELRPDRGRVNWRPVRRRRREAERRLAAMVSYVNTRGCRRKALLAWFGETGGQCAGCDGCGWR
jgi:ATP-dependent DNA helicase RecQ